MRHVVRDRTLFHDYADLERSISVGTATCGSLDALGSGDVEFRYPFGDIHVIFTLRDCLYAPMAPTNILSVGTLVERGMSCLFSPGGITKAFYPADHPKFPNLTFSATVVNRLSFLFLDFIPPVAKSVPQAVAFSARVSPPVTVAVSPSQSLPSSSPSQASRRQPNSPPRKKLPFTNPHYLIIDSTLSSHIFRDRSLFTTYIPSRRLHQNIFGTEIIIEGTGDVHVHVVVSGQSILFRFRDSWHVPSSPHHFLSASKAISLGNQIMFAGRSPRMIFSHKKRLLEPKFPKYMPFKQVDHFLVLEFKIPTQVSLSPLPTSTSTTTTTQPTTQSLPSFSLQASSSCLPFAGLAFNKNLLPTPRPVVEVVPTTSAVVASGSHGGADIHVLDGVMNLGVKDQAVDRPTTCGGDQNCDLDDVAMTNFLDGDVQIQAANTSGDDPNIRLKANSLEALNSSSAVFPQVGDNFIARLCTPSESHSSLSRSFPYIPYINPTLFPFSRLSFNNSLFHLSPPPFTFSSLTLFESSFSISVRCLLVSYSSHRSNFPLLSCSSESLSSFYNNSCFTVFPNFSSDDLYCDRLTHLYSSLHQLLRVKNFCLHTLKLSPPILPYITSTPRVHVLLDVFSFPLRGWDSDYIAIWWTCQDLLLSHIRLPHRQSSFSQSHAALFSTLSSPEPFHHPLCNNLCYICEGVYLGSTDECREEGVTFRINKLGIFCCIFDNGESGMQAHQGGSISLDFLCSVVLTPFLILLLFNFYCLTFFRFLSSTFFLFLFLCLTLNYSTLEPTSLTPSTQFEDSVEVHPFHYLERWPSLSAQQTLPISSPAHPGVCYITTTTRFGGILAVGDTLSHGIFDSHTRALRHLYCSLRNLKNGQTSRWTESYINYLHLPHTHHKADIGFLAFRFHLIFHNFIHLLFIGTPLFFSFFHFPFIALSIYHPTFSLYLLFYFLYS